ERVHVRAAALARDLERRGVRVVVALAGEHRLRAGALDRGELRERHAMGKHDGRGDAEELGRGRHALPVVPGGRRYDAVRPVARDGERVARHERDAFLERGVEKPARVEAPREPDPEVKAAVGVVPGDAGAGEPAGKGRAGAVLLRAVELAEPADVRLRAAAPV